MNSTGPNPSPAGHGTGSAGRMPLVGRAHELAALEELLEESSRSAVLLCGEDGSGKSRLATELAERAERRGWTVARGRAYPVEWGVPYALLSDALVPLLRSMDAGTMRVLSRGGEAELGQLFPALGRNVGPVPDDSAGDPDELRTRMFWSLAEFVKGHAARKPLLLVLDDLEWADTSSLELLHFLARQCVGHAVLIVCTYTEAERHRSPRLTEIERSLVSSGIARVQRVEPLTSEDVTELVSWAFSSSAQVVAGFSALLFGWTRGNPFFVEELLKALMAGGGLPDQSGPGMEWDAAHLALPGSIRDAVVAGLARCSLDARAAAELAAVIGTRAPYPVLASVSELDERRLMAALEELCSHRVVSERDEGGAVVYDFHHPLVRETLYQGCGLQRRRVLHGAVAEAMEAYWGDAALSHAGELAYHFAGAHAGQPSDKAVTYLAEAGRRALMRHADQEGAEYLRSAREHLGASDGVASHPVYPALLRDLARAHLRLGEYAAASEAWEDLLNLTPAGTPDVADLRRLLGLTAFWGGRRAEAFEHLEKGLSIATERGHSLERALLLLARSHCYQGLGQGAEALADARVALVEAGTLGDARLLASSHRSLALLYVWIGPPESAEHHAREAIELAAAAGEPSVEFWARWGLAVLRGMTGDTAGMARGIEEARALADQLRSPVLRLWVDELSIEMAYATGAWDSGIALGEQAIALARSLNQKALLPRLLVWTTLFHLGRGDMARARAMVEEACEVSGMNQEGPHDVHLVVPAYTGLAHYLVGLGDYAAAIEAARKGLEIAEGTGYTLWAVHRLLPILGEAYLWAGEIDKAELLGQRLRAYAERLNHKLGLAWADAGDALVRWKRGDAAGGAALMRKAAEALEAIPMIPYAVRIRRQLAGRLAEVGHTDEALSELRKVHDLFAQLGATLELEKARIQFHEIGQRPPPRGVCQGMAGLTSREMEIARLVALRRSNKAIGKELEISPRTVSTHLSNIFQKLELGSRAELADFMRGLDPP